MNSSGTCLTRVFTAESRTEIDSEAPSFTRFILPRRPSFFFPQRFYGSDRMTERKVRKISFSLAHRGGGVKEIEESFDLYIWEFSIVRG